MYMFPFLFNFALLMSEYILDEAKVTVKITAASGIPQPPEMLVGQSQ